MLTSVSYFSFFFFFFFFSFFFLLFFPFFIQWSPTASILYLFCILTIFILLVIDSLLFILLVHIFKLSCPRTVQ